MLLWRNPTQYMCGCGFGNHIEPSYWTLKWFVIFLPLIVTFHLFRSLWGHCGQLSKKCVGPGATRESPYGHLGPLWPQTHLIPCGKANRSHTGKFGTPQWEVEHLGNSQKRGEIKHSIQRFITCSIFVQSSTAANRLQSHNENQKLW